MDWKKVLKFDRAKMRRREKREKDAIDETHFSDSEKEHMRRLAHSNRAATESDHLEGRREKRRKMGLRTTRQDRIMGTAGTPRGKRVHRMKPEDRPKPRRKATKEEEEELRLRNKPPIMRNTRGQ